MDSGRFDDFVKRLAKGSSRRTVLKGLGGGVIGGALSFVRRGTSAAPAGKVGICHRTGSTTNPVVFITVSENAIPAHEAHGDTIDPDFDNDVNNCGGCDISCDDGDPCTIDTCVEGGCVHTDVDCSDFGDQCNVGVCVGGLCEAQPSNEGGSCNDGNACTQSDSCVAGDCVGSDPVVCTASDQCHVAGTCDPATGDCSDPAAPDGTPCNDGNICTTDECRDGVCTGTLPACDPPKIINPTTCDCECADTSLCAAGFDENCKCLCTQLVCEDNVEYCRPDQSCACGISIEGVHFCGTLACNNTCSSTSQCPAGFFCEAPGSCCGESTCVEPCPTSTLGAASLSAAPVSGRSRVSAN